MLSRIFRSGCRSAESNHSSIRSSSTQTQAKATAFTTLDPLPKSQKSESPTTHYRITLWRSPIGLPQRRRDSLASLGLKRRMDVSYQRHTPDAAGLILSVKELLKVQNVTEAEFEMGRNSSRKLIGEDRGYKVISNVLKRDSTGLAQ